MFAAPQVAGLDAPTQKLLTDLINLWRKKRDRNFVRAQYLDGKNLLKDLDIAIPPSMKDVEVAVGWPEKAVYGLAHRCMYDGLVAPDGSDDPFELRSLLRDNRFDIELPQAIASALAQSVSFVTTTPGDASAGEPPVVVMMHSAMWATGLWSRTKRALDAGLLINDVDDLERPTQFTILTAQEFIVCTLGPRGWYAEDVIPHALGRVPMEALPYRPTLDRPMGRSRISRKVMSITDRAVRTALRMEVAAELFSAPKFLLLGANEEAFLDGNGNPIPLWSWYLGRMNAISRDEEGEVPELEKISAESPEPHVAMMRQLAAEFAGETSIPLSSLGIVQDNPASAEAIFAGREDLVIEATNTNRVFGAALARVMQNAVLLRDGGSAQGMPDELQQLSIKWRNPALPSVVTSSDAMVKQISAMPKIAETSVALEELGYTDEQITRMEADWRRAGAGTRLDELVGLAREPGEEAADEAEGLKAKFDALGVAIRAGVDPVDAAARLGLGGIKFTGAVPAQLRMPTSETAGLEEK